jgi:hypothetical protein
MAGTGWRDLTDDLQGSKYLKLTYENLINVTIHNGIKKSDILVTSQYSFK